MATRRKLVSSSAAANTGMHSAANITMAADVVTVSFWWKAPNQSNSLNTLWAGHAGQFQIFTGSGTSTQLQARLNGSSSSAPTTTIPNTDQWYFVVVHLGVDHDGLKDIVVTVDGVEDSSRNNSTGSTEMSTAGTHYILGDDASGGNTDDGTHGELFDFCVFDGIVAVSDLQFNAGSWADLSPTALAALKYRIDGQNASDAGEDSSGNGHDFVVENGGVTLSATDLPPGANPAGGSTSVVGIAITSTAAAAPGSLTPAYAITGTGLSTGPVAGLGILTPGHSLTGVGLTGSVAVGAGNLSSGEVLNGVGLTVGPIVGAGALSSAGVLGSEGLISEALVAPGVLAPAYVLGGQGLSAGAALGAMILTPGWNLTGAGLAVAPAVAPVGLSPSYVLGVGSVVAGPVRMGAGSLSGAGVIAQNLAKLVLEGRPAQLTVNGTPAYLSFIGNP